MTIKTVDMLVEKAVWWAMNVLDNEGIDGTEFVEYLIEQQTLLEVYYWSEYSADEFLISEYAEWSGEDVEFAEYGPPISL